jgi:hypothetical protein
MIYLNRIRDQPNNILNAEDSSELMPPLDKIKTKDLKMSSLFASAHTNLGLQHSCHCISMDDFQTTVADSSDALINTTVRSLHVPSPIPIPPFEVISINNRISSQVSISQDSDNACINSPSLCLGKRKNDQIVDAGSCHGEIKQKHQVQVLCGNAMKRVKTFRNGLCCQGSFKEIKSVHETCKGPRTPYYQQIPTLQLILSRRKDIHAATRSSFPTLPLEKFKVPNPLEPETIPEVIQIPCSPPGTGTPLEDIPDDVSELGLDDHDTIPLTDV